MSIYAFMVPSITPGAGVADATNLVASTYMALQGGTSAQVNDVEEIVLGGLAPSVSSPMILVLGRDSTVVGTPTALASPNGNGPLGAKAGVLTAPAVGAVTGSVQAQRTNDPTLARKVYPFNAQGGVMRFNYSNTRNRFQIFGNTASLGECSLSAFTGSTAGAAMGMEIDYETE